MPMLSELHFMPRTSHTMENQNPTPNKKIEIKPNIEHISYITYKTWYIVIITTLLTKVRYTHSIKLEGSTDSLIVTTHR
jgi:hypothetical protein